MAIPVNKAPSDKTKAPAGARGGPAAKAASRNEVRIIGGAWRSRRIAFPGSEGLRPTPDRVRETLFNWLGHDLAGFRCLDLFAGSGALGFEALSMPPMGIGPVKQMVLSCDREAARRGVEALLKATQGSVRNELETLARKLYVAV